ncbi:hypothetical protein DSL72_006391 [Monilinia vaccinii-corymbosi]|uniref:Uncharacterized protein n=1 Tax=Monilinia vaccinii-corymbosi TaxID=61207 RepID=A0A8A3PNQ4_9HELO|nr:hypothetical protein DSL72_006391 [Monilinia vaccinii-corymbosi]
MPRTSYLILQPHGIDINIDTDTDRHYRRARPTSRHPDIPMDGV